MRVMLSVFEHDLSIYVEIKVSSYFFFPFLKFMGLLDKVSYQFVFVLTYVLAYEIAVLTCNVYAPMSLINVHAAVSSKSRVLNSCSFFLSVDSATPMTMITCLLSRYFHCVMAASVSLPRGALGLSVVVVVAFSGDTHLLFVQISCC